MKKLAFKFRKISLRKEKKMKKLGTVIFVSVIGFVLLSFSSIKSSDEKFTHSISSENYLLYATSVSCGEWNLQQDGCYERVCCCDKNGSFWCERCCPDSSGKCTPYKVNC